MQEPWGPASRPAHLMDEGGVLVATRDTQIDDADMFELIDAGRRRPARPK